MPIDWNVTVLAALGVGLLGGIGLGALLRGRSGSAERARADQLETELEQTREDLEAHRDDVARHFQETSDLFRDVTEQYSRLHSHLAAGARSFSTDAVPVLDSLETPLLAHTGAEAAEPVASAEPVTNAEPTVASAPAPGVESPAPERSAPSESSPRVKSNGGLAVPSPAPPA
jgi:uncharacterized membrane-anchored protein YhcB (DUF1043 family)